MPASVTEWVDLTVERARQLSPMYAKAVQEENIVDLLLVRHQLAKILTEADLIITDALARNIERRLAETASDRT